MSFELQDVVNDPDLAEPWTILRSTGSFVLGTGWSSTTVSVPFWGVTSVASDDELKMVPEADQVHGARSFYSQQEMYTTNADREDSTAGVSDICVWNGFQYRIVSVGPFQNRGGFWRAIAVRMRGN